MKTEIPVFKTNEELFSYLKTNKDDLIYAKKSEMKKADGFSANTIQISGADVVNKGVVDEDVRSVKVRAIINTTYVKDSHGDVHIDGLWKKSLDENSRIKHLQEHQMLFSKVIADKDDLKAFTKTYSWKDLGYDFEGKTQALVFDSVVKESRNKEMYKEYKDGNVDNHSVGMYYVKIALALDSDDEDYKEEKAEFDKHIDKIVNKDVVKRDKWFWAVYEAKAIEGSAVPMGSNPLTPTMPIKSEVIKTDKELRAEAIKRWIMK
jgi:hypothetical protein